MILSSMRESGTPSYLPATTTITDFLRALMNVKGGGMLGQEGGAKVYHQRFWASVNVRASCSGVVSQRQAGYRLVSG